MLASRYTLTSLASRARRFDLSSESMPKCIQSCDLRSCLSYSAESFL